ncbi:MAG: 6-phosphofructokinase [Aquificae bacterium]|nr:6-phosphofructokinase [Aquificota bacterium]
MKKVAVLTSGGDAPGLNACIRAIVRTAYYYEISVIGIKRGYRGLIEKDYCELDPRRVGGIINKGGTILHSSREPRFKHFEFRKKAFETLKELQVDALLVIGGNGSISAANIFAKEFPINVIGIPKTIDNDLYGTDYTIGFDTAVNNAVDAVDKIRDTTISHERIFVVEVMGRDSGFIALDVGIATGADITLIPEYPFPIHIVIQKLIDSYKKGKTFSIIILAEGVAKAQELASVLEQKLKDYAIGGIRYSVLGHIQRGGSPTAFDRNIASRFGAFAVERFLHGEKNFMVAYEKGEIKTKPLEIPFGKVKKPDLEVFELTKKLTI